MFVGGGRGGGSPEEALITFGARPVHAVSASAMNSAYQLSEVIWEELWLCGGGHAASRVSSQEGC